MSSGSAHPAATPPAARARRAGALDPLRLSQQVLHHLPSGVVYFSSAGLVQDANPAARAALGFADPRGLDMTALLREAELREADGALLGPAAVLFADTYRTRRILQRKMLRYTAPDGVGRRLGVTLFPISGADGAEAAPPGLICLLTDLTSIHALEEELRRRQSLSALGEMAAGIAHEFKNALATISGYGQMLASSLGGSERELASKLLEQVRLLTNVSSEFLAFARPLALSLAAVESGGLLRECADSLRVQDFPGVEIAISGAFPHLAGDPSLLRTAFANLLRNGCESLLHSRQPGRVMVRAEAGPGGVARLLFTDSGPGVPVELREKIFIPFFTTKPGGTGLGLAMAHKIIAAHRGSLLLDDATAGHTVFAVELPLAAPGHDLT
ncbi:MAG: two-component system sensor histidine kinase NtrB [Terriglobales bacterium]